MEYDPLHLTVTSGIHWLEITIPEVLFKTIVAASLTMEEREPVVRGSNGVANLAAFRGSLATVVAGTITAEGPKAQDLVVEIEITLVAEAMLVEVMSVVHVAFSGAAAGMVQVLQIIRVAAAASLGVEVVTQVAVIIIQEEVIVPVAAIVLAAVVPEAAVADMQVAAATVGAGKEYIE